MLETGNEATTESAEPSRSSLYESVFRLILEEVHIWQLERDESGAIKTWRLLNANPVALKNWGKRLSDIKGKTTNEIFNGVDAVNTFLPIVEKIFREKKPYTWEVYFEGTDQTLQMTSIPIDDAFISTGFDVSHIRRSERDLRVAQERLLLATEAAHIGIWEYDLSSHALTWDNSMYKIYGVDQSATEIPYNTWEKGVHPEDRAKATFDLEKSIKNERDFESDFRIICQDTQKIKYIHAHAVYKSGNGEESDRLIGVNIDVSDQKKAQQEIEVLAYFDTLTGLPNRGMIEKQLCQSIALSERTKTNSALIFINIDSLKKINDTAGHTIGDELLSAFGKRVNAEIRPADTFGRFGGDEFIIILNNLNKHLPTAIHFSNEFAHNIVELLQTPFELSHAYETISASFGITLFNGVKSVGEILREADLAMHMAKGSGRNRIHFYDPAMQKLFIERVQIENELMDALTNGQIDVHYQLQVNDDGSIRGAEALARWQHPTKGFISPDTFIPIAEVTGKIQALGAWIFTRACSDFKNHIQAYADDDFVISINVSSIQIFESDFTEVILSQIKQIGINPAQVKLEITESAIIDRPELTHQKMLSLKKHGVQFSLDDFGTGYSSLTCLKNLPVDELKIDKTFVSDILLDIHSSAIAQTVIVLAKSLGLQVVAEGIEQSTQKIALQNLGCRIFQGYLFSKPLPLSEFLTLIKTIQRAQPAPY
ncbi:putative bifunctional diguanylate cyclase/phosphodiesterase [Salinispirillum marinum]|uniref:Bifunctional diguanylate cyclase/phosphodiesterase n=2 Tax=Saccharospirillaceae TaxID=255527 RepID=A0ABV8BCN5_9GAMM